MGRITSNIWNVFYFLSKYALIIIVILIVYSFYDNSKVQSSKPVTKDDVEISVQELKDQIYEINQKDVKTVSGKKVYTLEIDGITYNWSEQELNKYVGTTSDAVKTSKYYITAKIKEQPLLLFNADKVVEVAHYSFLNQKAFTEDEISKYTKNMLSELTYQRYKTLHLKNADDYKQNLSNMKSY